ncbi:MAG: HD domain-containing protein, partial [Blautia sp.]|nr:HD domain-containing protein [Blautia sp.]
MQKKNRIPIFVQVALCLALNMGGDQLSSRMNWPIWLDSVGTVLYAYSWGPFSGAVVGAASNLLSHILYGVPWYYALISMLIAVIVGISARRGRFDSLLGTMTVGAFLSTSVAMAAYPINFAFNGLSTGNNWGDAVIGYMGEAGLPRWINLMIGQLYVELLDKLCILLMLFVLTKLYQVWAKKENPHKGKNEKAASAGVKMPAGKVTKKGKKTALTGLFLGLAIAGAFLSERSALASSFSDSSFNDYVQTVYSTSNGLPCGEANAIAMTGDGIVWIGTYAGLYRYNGREFRWMDKFDSVRNVNCLYVDEEGRLWIGTNDNGLSIMIKEQVVNVIDQKKGLPNNSVKSIIKSSDGYYYIGTTGSMQILTLNCGLKRVGNLSEVTYADHVAADENGNVVAINNDGTLFVMRQGQIVVSKKLQGSQTVFKSCTFDPDGNLLVATTGNEIYRFRLGTDFIETLEVMECPGLQNIKNLYYLEDGSLFVCADNGIAYFHDGEYEKINTNDFNNSIDNMLIDYQGNLWLTSSRLGLLRLAPSDFRDIYSIAGMENRVVNTIVRWGDTFYVGTDKGMDAFSLDGRHQITDEVTERFTGVRIRCMLVDSKNHLWVCTYGSGLMELEPDGSEHLYNQEKGAFGNRARVAMELEDGTILAAGDSGLSFIKDHEVVKTIGKAEGRISSMVLTIIEREDGTILAGTDGNGIAVIRGRQVERMLTRQDGLSSDVILRLVPDEEGDGVFVVTSNGLCYIHPEGTITQLSNFPYYNNYDIWCSEEGVLYVLSSAGIYLMDRDELFSGKEELSYELLDLRRGLSGSLTANAWTWYEKETHELFFPCDTGVFSLNTESSASTPSLFRMNVPGVYLDGTYYRMERGATLQIPRGTTRVEIQPEIINYTIQDPYVGYWLEGFEPEWKVLAQNAVNTIAYTNLPTGNYIFHLAVFDRTKEHVLAERTYPMTKEMEMYDNSWFIGYILFLPMFTVLWVTWLLFKRHEAKIQEELERANRQIEMGKQTVIAIARTVDAKDERTSEHSKRVALYSKQIARSYGLDEKQCQDIEWAAQMHDIGKIAIPDAILNKDSRLTDEEYAIMKSHTTRGAEILKDFTLLDNVIEGAEFHHERYDGRGYPKGLKGMEIPLYARIIGVADAFDAMTANRVYRKQMDFGYVLGELERGRGTQFDPEFVDILLRLIEEGTIDLHKIYHVAKE